MAFNLKGVQVRRDAQGTSRHLEYLQTPFTVTGLGSGEGLASAYVRETADIYGIPLDWLGGLEHRVDPRNPTPPRTKDTLVDGLSLAQVKDTLGTTVVSFVQLRHGLPIWEAGVSVVVQGGPLRVT